MPERKTWLHIELTDNELLALGWSMGMALVHKSDYIGANTQTVEDLANKLHASVVEAAGDEDD